MSYFSLMWTATNTTEHLYHTFFHYSWQQLYLWQFIQENLPFYEEKSFHSLLGDVRSIKKLFCGGMLVEISSANQS